ncbi:MAG: class I SAM-dependent methyltransferase [Acidobacteria bacterium]|nr:class I SAM-dependent methyltransferase [Acidobacteriota bacterium]
MKILEGKHLAPATPEVLAALRHRYDRCLVDIGTGDGLFPYHWAREHPEDLAVALDPVTTGFAKLAVKARRKLAKGGAPNLLFAAGAVEDLPGPFAGWADLITVNFPWGSLMRALVLPVPPVLERIAALARPDAQIVLLLNTSIFHDSDYLDRLSLPPLTEERAREALLPAYAAAGLRIDTVEPLVGAVPHRTSWGQRLVLGSSRSTLMLRGTRSPEGVLTPQEVRS